MDFTVNGDGTITLLANVVFPHSGDSKVYAHEVKVRPLENGGWYVSNRILSGEAERNATWHTDRLTREEWEEIYGNAFDAAQKKDYDLPVSGGARREAGDGTFQYLGNRVVRGEKNIPAYQYRIPR